MNLSLYPVRVIQIIVAAGITIAALGLLWIVLTAPISQLIAQNLIQDSDMLGTVQFLSVFFGIFCLLAGIGVIAWGWVKTVEEREYGFTTP